MDRTYAKLQKIEYNGEESSENNDLFLYYVQNWLLLALREKDRLTISQYRYAARSLKQQLQQKIRRAVEKGNGK